MNTVIQFYGGVEGGRQFIRMRTSRQSLVFNRGIGCDIEDKQGFVCC